MPVHTDGKNAWRGLAMSRYDFERKAAELQKQQADTAARLASELEQIRSLSTELAAEIKKYVKAQEIDCRVEQDDNQISIVKRNGDYLHITTTGPASHTLVQNDADAESDELNPEKRLGTYGDDEMMQEVLHWL